MTYYEELGVLAGASAAEIHHAYRQVSRLLHPDPHADPDLRRVAECQMARLNDIHSILSDEARRASYDASLIAPRLPGRTAGPWIAAAAVIATVVWIASFSGKGRTELAPIVRAVAPEPPVRANPVSRPSAAASAMGRWARRDGPGRPLVPHILELPPVESAGPGPAPLPATASLPALDPLGSPPTPPRVRAPDLSLSGTWFYAGGSENARLPYRPEYIEAVIVERAGLVRGRYRARYRVGDRAISPIVSFAFEGDRLDPDAALVWRGPAGARGEVHLRLIAGTLLEVSWSAEEMGSELGLAAGRAVLTRAR